ncbi:MAG TPA: hypothetical protein VF027_00110 [Sphingomicrobium sp.]
MARSVEARLSARTRANATRLAGLAIIGLSLGAALMPAGKTISSDVIGALLVAAGLIEIVAGSLRLEVKPYAMAAGAVTALAGLLFVLNPETHFFPNVTLVIAWLALRSLILLYAGTHLHGSVRTWVFLSAGMDFLLAVLLVAGLSISTLVVSIFGPTPQLVASFAWVLAASFVVNGLLLLEVASCQEEAGD